MRAGLSGLKDTLRVLAAPHQEEGEDTGGTVVCADREIRSLHLDLDWPENVKRVGVVEFDRRWEKEGIWELLAQVGKRRVIQIGRTADDGEATPWSEIAKCFERLNTTRSIETTSKPDLWPAAKPAARSFTSDPRLVFHHTVLSNKLKVGQYS